jgi:DNA-binding beta-propeller fold protein YncE
MTIISAFSILTFALGSAPSLAPDQLFVTRIDSASLEILNFDGTVEPFASTASTGEELELPFAAAFSPQGELFVTDGGRERIAVFDAGANLVRMIGAPGDFADPRGLAFGPQGELYVASATGPAVTVFDSAGTKVRVIGTQLGTIRAEGVAFGANGHLYVASQWHDAVFEFDPSGAVVDKIGSSAVLDDPIGLAFGPDGYLYVASENTHEIVVFDAAHQVVGRFGPESGLHYPLGIAFGPDARLYVSSLTDEVIHVFDVVNAAVAGHNAIPLPGITAFLAFSPHRRTVVIEGSLTESGSFTKDHEEVATLTYSPNFNTAFIAFEGAGTSLLESAFGSTVVLAGTHAIEGALSAKRQFLGQQIPQQGVLAVSATLGLRVVTTPQNNGMHTFMKATGTFDVSRQATIFRGKIRTKK